MTHHRSPWLAVAAAIAIHAPSSVRADNQEPPPGYPPPAQASPPDNAPPGDGPPPPGSAPIYPAPGYGPPGYGSPNYGPPVNGLPGYNPPVYATPVYGPEEIAVVDDSRPVPFGYTKVSRRRKGLIIGGAVTLGATYIVSALAAAVAADINRADGSSADVSALLLPVAGPFVELGQTDSSVAQFYLVGLGLGETAGAIMLLYGLTSPRTLLIRNDQLSITPLLRHGASGLTLSGRF